MTLLTKSWEGDAFDGRLQPISIWRSKEFLRRILVCLPRNKTCLVSQTWVTILITVHFNDFRNLSLWCMEIQHCQSLVVDVSL